MSEIIRSKDISLNPRIVTRFGEEEGEYGDEAILLPALVVDALVEMSTCACVIGSTKMGLNLLI